jgi:hypothetical protein
MDYVTLIVTVWLGLGVLLAMTSTGGDDGSDFTCVGRTALFVLVMLLWPMVFLPIWRDG